MATQTQTAARVNLADIVAELEPASIGEQFAEYDSGYIADIVAEIADAAVDIYSIERREYALEHPESARDVVVECLAESPQEYFKARPEADLENYLEHLGACAQYYDASNFLYENLVAFVKYGVLYNVTRGHGVEWITPEQLEQLDGLNYDDNNEDIGDLIAEALEIVAA